MPTTESPGGSASQFRNFCRRRKSAQGVTDVPEITDPSHPPEALIPRRPLARGAKGTVMPLTPRLVVLNACVSHDAPACSRAAPGSPGPLGRVCPGQVVAIEAYAPQTSA